jgi:hypothetical protein
VEDAGIVLWGDGSQIQSPNHVTTMRSRAEIYSLFIQKTAEGDSRKRGSGNTERRMKRRLFLRFETSVHSISFVLTGACSS